MNYPGYYDKKGKVINQHEWGELFQNTNYQIVGRYEDERILISTVWMGIDHSWGQETPLIFETMTFVKDGTIDSKYDQLQWRWTTEERAKEAHEIVVNCYKENKDPIQALREVQR